MPAASGVAIEVPLFFVVLQVSSPSVPVKTAALVIESPGATKSGLIRSLVVGPPDENTAIFSCLGSAVAVEDITPETDKVVAGSSFTISINSSPIVLGTPSTGIVAAAGAGATPSRGMKNGVTYDDPRGTNSTIASPLSSYCVYDGKSYHFTRFSCTNTTATPPAVTILETIVAYKQLSVRCAFPMSTTLPETSSGSHTDAEHASAGSATTAIASSNVCNPEAGDESSLTALIVRISPLRCA